MTVMKKRAVPVKLPPQARTPKPLKPAAGPAASYHHAQVMTPENVARRKAKFVT